MVAMTQISLQAHEKALLILDGKAPQGHHTGRARTIVLSSPTVENWTEYRKGSDTSEYVAMPTN